MTFGSLLRKCIFAAVIYSVALNLSGSGYPEGGFNGTLLPVYPSLTGTGVRDGFINQASLAYNTDLSAGFSYYSRFGVSELAVKSLYLTVPHGKGSLGFRYDNYGFEQLMYHSLSTAAGMRLSETVSLGVEAGIKATASPVEDVRMLTASGQAGIIVSVSENTRLGVHIVNPVPNSLRSTSLPSAIRAGAGTTVSDRLTVSVVLEKRTLQPLSLSAGICYDISSTTGIRAGYSSSTQSLGFTLTCRFGKLEPELSFLTHNRLGLSSMASIFRSFRK